MRLPLGAPIFSRDGTLDKGAKLVNVYVESKGERGFVVTRPGISTADASIVGVGHGIFSGAAGLTTAQFPNSLSTAYFANGSVFGTLYIGSVAELNSLVAGSQVTTGLVGLPFYLGSTYYLASHAVGVTSASGWGQVWSASTFTSSFSQYQWTLFSTGLGAASTDPSIGGGAYTIAHQHTDGRIYLASRLGTSQNELAFSANASTWTQFALPGGGVSDGNMGAFLSVSSTLYLFTSRANTVYYSATPSVSSSWDVSSYTTGLTSNFVPSGSAFNTADSTWFIFGNGDNGGEIYRSVAGASSWASVTTLASSLALVTGAAGLYAGVGYIVEPTGKIVSSTDMSTWAAEAVSTKSTNDRTYSFFVSSAPAPIVSQVSTGFNAAGSTYLVSTGTNSTFAVSTQGTLSNPNNAQVDMVYG